MSIAADARASSIGTTAWPKRTIPARSPSAWSTACPMHDADVLDRVVRARLQVALDRHVEVEAAVTGERVEHVVEEADPGRARAAARAVERQRQGDVGLVGGAGDLCGAAHARRSMDSP